MFSNPIRLSAILLAALLLAGGVRADETAVPAPTSAAATSQLAEDASGVLKGFAQTIDGLEAKLRDHAGDDVAIVDVRNELEEQARAVLESVAAFRPRLDEINNRLDQIGAPPADGEADEPAALKDERAALTKEKADINAVLGEADNLSVRVAKLVAEIAQMRRDLFASQLSKRYDITAALNIEVLGDFIMEVEELTNRIGVWVRYVLRYKLGAVALATVLSLLAGAILLIGGRKLFRSLIFADPDLDTPSYLSRLSVAFWSTLLPSMALAVLLGSIYFLSEYFDILRDDLSRLMVTFFNVLAIVFFVNRLSRAAFSPRLPNWRLIPVTSVAAGNLYWLVWALSWATGVDFILSRANDVLGSPLSLTIAKSLLATFIVGVLLILISWVKPFRYEDGTPKPWPRWLRYPLIGLGIGTIAAGAFGYIGLARFMSQQIVVTGAILSTMYIGHLTARALSDFGAFKKTMLGRWLDGRFGPNDRMDDQLGLVFSVSIHLLVIAIGVPLILLQWGFQWGDITTWVLSVMREIRIGSVSFSIFGLLTGALVFIFGYFATRWFQSWLDGSVMTRGRVDAGVRNSIRTVVGYLGVAIAALIGVSAAGISLSSLAYVAGGLSLGIGFGLQNIVSNFVSGLILLAERPFKAGDWIVAGGTSGTVKKISVRATEIETFQRQSVILPNSELINAAVGNWTHRNKLGRVEIPIGASYDSDPRKVHRVLSEIAGEHPLILKNPEPMVVFKNFGDSSLDFEIRFFLADITNQLGVQNDLRFSIFERFKNEGIGIPFPQRDLHVRMGDVVAPKAGSEPETEAPVEMPAPKPAPKRRRRSRSHLGDE